MASDEINWADGRLSICARRGQGGRQRVLLGGFIPASLS
ncbi:hypothetical protein R69749_06319 [Paraburkholderia domus]|uniref:Uncharacterized protein n=1 Tax=Paraburkholderia nemoris TaxID=2793076 RepID=A0ABM8T7J6_9BURK|nr:hypothetical protein R75777_07906 [Paraburkholderia nemoris]CAE6862588.1 hypothetical protein R69776_08089 [Paraburkholderia nemoris]CAE6872364.1 hypothetical protein R69749_06319 [Paraburkholderia domus]